MRQTSGGYGSSAAQPLLAALAARQHGVARTKHLRAIGLDSSAVSKYAACGRLHRKYPGVYTIGHTALSREGELLAAVFAGGDGAALGHMAAMELAGITRRRVAPIDVIVPRRHQAVKGIRFHRGRLDSRDVTVRNGVPVTTVARTLVDLSDSLHPLELAHLIHEAAFRNRLNLAAVQTAMTRANGRRGLGALEQAIDYHLNGSAGFKSRNEKRYLALIAGLPEPLVNVDFHGLEIDFRWPEFKLAVEVDGPGHGRPRTKREDAAVDIALAAAGYALLRFTDTDLWNRPDQVVKRTRSALVLGGWGS